MLPKKQQPTWNNKDYKFFVVHTRNDEIEILSGWEYKEDAKDDQEGLREVYLDDFGIDFYPYLKVYTRRYMETLLKGDQ